MAIGDKKGGGLLVLLGVGFAYGASASASCPGLPSHDQLKAALLESVAPSAGGSGPENGGLEVPMWATMVDRYGRVCEVVYSGANQRAPWPASRVISAQKAYTTNALSAKATGQFWSTALLYTPTQPGQFLWGLAESNPVDPAVVYAGSPNQWGTPDDPMGGKIPGGINTFGGGVALWQNGTVVGGIGVSGDTSCADHNIALRVRNALGLARPKPNTYADNIVYDIVNGVSPSGVGHPDCPGNSDTINELITKTKQPPHDGWPTGGAKAALQIQ